MPPSTFVKRGAFEPSGATRPCAQLAVHAGACPPPSSISACRPGAFPEGMGLAAEAAWEWEGTCCCAGPPAPRVPVGPGQTSV